MTDLCKLARLYGSDKARFYTPFYDRILSPRRDSVRRVLELGIGYEELMLPYARLAGLDHYRTGASLLMWRDYFPNAEVWGLDLEYAVCKQQLEGEERIHVEYVDERDLDSLATVGDRVGGGGFDLIVEDGLHEPWAQMRALDALMPLLAPDGIYIMEDVMQYVDMTAAVPYPTRMVEFGEARVMVVRGPRC